MPSHVAPSSDSSGPYAISLDRAGRRGIYRLGLIRGQAAARGAAVTVVIDFIHGLEYLWKAAWCFHGPRDPAMGDWVTAQRLDTLHGRVAISECLRDTHILRITQVRC